MIEQAGLFDKNLPGGPMTERCPHGRRGFERCPWCDAPYVAGSATSHAAAAQIAPVAPNLRERVFAYIETHGPVTDEEIANGCELNPSTARPRRIELARQCRIMADGTKLTSSGRSAVAWRKAE
jgi:hypothetical protein